MILCLLHRNNHRNNCYVNHSILLSCGIIIMALWQQRSPYVVKSLTDGLLCGARSDTSRIDMFEFVSCHLEVSIGDFKQGERLDRVQMNFMDGTIKMCNSRGEFNGLLGWNLWVKETCLWSLLDSNGILFQEQKFSIEPDKFHYFDCVMHCDVPPFRKGECVPTIILDWKNQRINMMDDSSGRKFEGFVGWFILKKRKSCCVFRLHQSTIC
jgi:hypothetical protein